MENKIEKHQHKDVVVTRRNGELVVSSRQIAEDFQKMHKHILESIRNLVDEN